MLIDSKVINARFDKILIVDRDDTIIYDKGESQSINNIEFIPDSINFLAQAYQLNYGIFMVTNQSVIGKGLKEYKDVKEINDRIDLELKKNGGKLSCVIICPHKIENNCECRKPKNLMYEKAFEISSAEKNKSFVIGNSWVDYVAAKKSKVKCHIYKKRLILGEVKVPSNALFENHLEILSLLN
jgi:D-glycero-D-manno-heptose 1,7-bisphosphate phosphatase